MVLEMIAKAFAAKLEPVGVIVGAEAYKTIIMTQIGVSVYGAVSIYGRPIRLDNDLGDWDYYVLNQAEWESIVENATLKERI